MPLGVPAPGTVAVTVAVRVVDWPKMDGFTDDVSAVLDDAWLTVWPLTRAPVLPAKSVSPL